MNLGKTSPTPSREEAGGPQADAQDITVTQGGPLQPNGEAKSAQTQNLIRCNFVNVKPLTSQKTAL